MLSKRAFLALLTPLGVGCSRSKIVEPVTGADRIEVTFNSFEFGNPHRVITDLDQVETILGFINARLDDWHYPLATMPAGNTHLNMYKGEILLGYFGATSGVFLRYPANGGLRFQRHASAQETSQFHSLLS